MPHTPKIPSEKSFPPLDLEEQKLMDRDYDLSAGVSEGPLFDTFVSAARNYTEKKKALSIKMGESTVSRLKARSKQDAIPYQTLINSVMKKWLDGRLVERDQ